MTIPARTATARTLVFALFGLLLFGCLTESFVSDVLGRDLRWTRAFGYALVGSAFLLLIVAFEKALIPDRLLRFPGRRWISNSLTLVVFVLLAWFNHRFQIFPAALLLCTVFFFRLLCYRQLDGPGSWNEQDKRALRQYLIITLIWGAFALLYCFYLYPGGYHEIVWPSTDARHYHWLSNSLIALELSRSHFQIGLPLVISPFNFIAGSFSSRGVEQLVALNGASQLFFTLFIIPLSIFLILQSVQIITSKIRQFSLWSVAGLTLLVAVLFYIYALGLQPNYISPRDALYHPSMMFGLVPAVEPLNFLFAALCLRIIITPNFLSPLVIGAIVAIAVLAKETNAIIALVFFGFLWIRHGSALSCIAAGASSLVFYAPQFLFNFFVYGSVVASNRKAQWGPKADKWHPYVTENFQLSLNYSPPLVSPVYSATNSLLLIENYLPAIVLFLLSLIVLFRIAKAHAIAWLFCVSTVTSFALFHSCYFRIGATFRYLHAVLPFVWVVWICAMLAGAAAISNFLATARLRKVGIPHPHHATNSTPAPVAHRYD